MDFLRKIGFAKPKHTAPADATSPFRPNPAGVRKLSKLLVKQRAYSPDSNGCMQMSPDGHFAVLNNGILWDLQEDRIVFEREHYWLNGGFTADSRLCLMACQAPKGHLVSDAILLIRTETGETVRSIREAARCVALMPDGHSLITAFETQDALHFRQIRTSDGNPVSEWTWRSKSPGLIPTGLYPAENGKVLYVQLSDDLQRSGNGRRQLLKFRVDTGEALFRDTVTADICPQSFSGTNIVTSSGLILDAADGTPVRNLGRSGPVALLPDGVTAAIGVDIFEWDACGFDCFNILTGERICRRDVWQDPAAMDLIPKEIALSRDGRHMLYVLQCGGRTAAALFEVEWLYGEI